MWDGRIEWDAVIVGGGAAGLSAAQMLGRSRRRTLVIDAGEPRNRAAAQMHGVLGLDGVAPARLLETGRAEAGAYGVELVTGSVSDLVDEGERLRVVRDDGTEHVARAVVIATGVRDDLPDVPGLREEWGRGVLHCPYCHGWEVRGRRLGVLATAPQSLHQAQLVRQLSDRVVVFTAAAEPLGDEAAGALVARGIEGVPAAVRCVRRTGAGLEVTTEDGGQHVVDALFTGGIPVVDLGFADGLDLARADGPGAPLLVDPTGSTSHPRVFAAGDAVAPFANVPVSMGTGSLAGAAANAALVAEDVRRAVAARTARRNEDWEQRHAGSAGFWSGRVNDAVAATTSGLQPGTALDVGCGEGGDVVWLAERGWRTTGIDVAATAIERAAALARSRGVDVDLRVGDGAASLPDGARFDLVLACFLHSWEPDFPRIRLLQDAAARVAPGGRLLVVSHTALPHLHDHAPMLRTPEAELALLGLDPSAWRTEAVEVHPREVEPSDGGAAHPEDGVLLLRRAG